jgi:branched-chain amino acid transport system substrate-binding protein
MAEDHDRSTGASGSEETPLTRKPISRRDFLKVAGATGLTVGALGGLGGALSACGSSGGGGGASASAGATGRTIKVGFVTPLTGPLQTFGQLDTFIVSQWKEAVKGGVKCGDGKTHPIEILVKDSQSDTNRAATVAGDLITNDGVDIMMVASTPDTVNPVSTAAESFGVPCVSNDCPWQPYYFGRQKNPAKPVPFKWTYHFFWGLEDVTAVFTGMWNQLQTNKLVGEMWPNDADGNGWANPVTGQPPMLKAAGYTFVSGGKFQDGAADYTPQITKFKAAGCEILSGVFIPPDFVNFWHQSYRQGFKPIAATVGKALLFPAELEAIGPTGYGLTTECWWSPWHPFTSSLTGQTCQQLADAWTSSSGGKEWAQPLLHYGVFEVVVDALKRASSVDDKQVIVDAIKATDMDTIAGKVTWSAGAPLNPVPNVCRTVLVGGMWTKGTTYPFELLLVDTSHAAAAPFNVTIPENGKVAPIKYA